MQFHAIYLQGNILSAELLDQIQNDQQGVGQAPKDFWLEPGAKVRDEIQRAWADVKDQYQIFNRRLEKLKDGDTGRADTRKYWMLDFFDYLGYKLEPAPETALNGKFYKISHRTANLDGLPVHIAGIHESLDRKPDGRGSMSPHALVQEYLNVTEHVYGLVTNGAQLRLLRDSSRLTRLSYLEFDLNKILEEDRYADFALLYRLLHASRMPRTAADAPASLIERYHTDSLAAGSRIREKLAGSVEHAIVTFANGFLKHPDNDALRAALQTGTLRADGLYDELLRLIYRLLFLMVTEERNLIYPEPEERQPLDPKEATRRQIYYRYYAVNRLRQMAEKRLYDQQRYADLWDGLAHTFRLFEAGDQGKALSILPLAGDLFSSHALAHLGQCRLDNESLLRAVFLLSAFENEQRTIIRVNYAALDVEEFGSVYEGLLEYQPAVVTQPWQFLFEKGSARSSSGSHYTPDELVHPLIKHSLDYLIEDRLKQDPTGESLLTLKVADVACGSGHILLAAARRIALKLAQARTQEDQPAPAPYRRALREVVQNCIYGVDKNPLAVELCKVALWLEAHNPGQPLNFLDHRIKCGDAIVGLAHKSDLDHGIADEAFNTLTGDEKEVAKTFRDKNVKERKERTAKALQLKAEFEKSTDHSVQEAIAEYKTFNQLPETTPDEIERKAKAYRRFLDGKGFSFLKAMADTQVAQFFIPKTDGNKENLMTDGDYRLILSGYKGWQDKKVAKATAVAIKNRFFHWFLEFPEVIAQGGFDCVVGNPPYLGGKKISGSYGDAYNTYLKINYIETTGSIDLVVYFLRRISKLSRKFISLITTQSIHEGISKIAGIQYLITNKLFKVNFAIKNLIWPGKAKTTVDIFTLSIPFEKTKIIYGTKECKFINSSFEPEEESDNPRTLLYNSSKGFQGCVVSGEGFIIEGDEYLKNKFNPEVVKPYLIGDDLISTIMQDHTRYIIYFNKWPIEKAIKYEKEFSIVESKVKPEREKVKRGVYREKWWQFAEKAISLYNSIEFVNAFFAVAKTSKHLAFVIKQDKDTIYDQSLTVISLEGMNFFVILQSSIHNEWARKYSTSQGGTPRYNPTNAFHNFPFPSDLKPSLYEGLQKLGNQYYKYRCQLMIGIQLGLTQTYNLFHARTLPAPERAAEVSALPPKDIEKHYGKETAHLVKHLAGSKEATYTLEQSLAGIHRLRALHVEMDQAVLEAYGWSDITLRHDFYEVDYLPENDRVRYTIHPEARREVLKRLLELNHRVYAEEVARGLHDKKGNKKKVSPEVEAGGDESYPGEQGRLFEDGGRQGKLF